MFYLGKTTLLRSVVYKESSSHMQVSLRLIKLSPQMNHFQKCNSKQNAASHKPREFLQGSWLCPLQGKQQRAARYLQTGELC